MAATAYGANSEQVTLVIDRICALTPDDVARLIEADISGKRLGASTAQVTLDGLSGDTRDPEAEAHAFERALELLNGQGRLAEYVQALSDAWSCIPVNVVQGLARVPEVITATRAWMSIEELVRRVLVAEVARDLLTDEVYRRLTRAWRWSGLWPDQSGWLLRS